MSSNNPNTGRLRRLRLSPALVVAFVALFAALGGVGYATGKLKPNAVKSKNIKDGAITSDKLADGAVTTPKFAPDATAPNAMNAVNAANADKLGGVAPGHCQLGWLKASAVIDTSPLNDANQDMDVAGFDCASNAENAFHVHRLGTGRYTVTIQGLDSGTSISSSANVGGGAANVVTAASTVGADGKLSLNVWQNPDTGALVDGKTVSLVVY
jgi:hypothetical protein